MDTVTTPAGPPRIALIHALRDSVEPILGAFARGWPEAQTFNLLDDSLSAAVAAEGSLTTPIVERFLKLGRDAAAAQVGGRSADAILFTCSAFGPGHRGGAERTGHPGIQAQRSRLRRRTRARPADRPARHFRPVTRAADSRTA